MSLLPPPSTLPPNAIVDTYIRDSGGPTQDRSTDQQLREIQKYCATHKLQLRHKFIDQAKSGGSTATRESFNAMLDTCAHAETRPQGLLLWNYARFARDLDDAIYYKSLLKSQHVTVHSLTDPVPEGYHGRIVELFIDISNEEKRRQTSTDAKRGLRDLVLLHRCVPGSPPRGFYRSPVNTGTRRDGTPRIAHSWEPDPEKIPIIQEAFAMKAAGASLSQIHAKTKLYSSLNSYRTFFNNQIYIGILLYGGEIIPDYCDPIVDIATWKSVQARLKKAGQGKRKKIHPRRVNSPYLLSSIILCDNCGAPMNGNTATKHGKRDEAYRCSKSKRKAGCNKGRISRHKLETAVLGTMKNYILLPDNLQAIHDITAKNLLTFEAKRRERRKIVSNERQSLSKRIANITLAIADGGHSGALLDTLTQLENERALLIAETKELKEEIQPLPELSFAEIEQQSQNIIHQLETATPEQIRIILRGYLYQVRAQKKDGEIFGTITYYYPPDIQELPPPF
jgi:site-specific DNA recombinase